MKVYLDTNVILDLFVNHAKLLVKGINMVMPENYKFLISQRGNFDFVASVLTKAEIVRELVSGFGTRKEKIEPIWLDFVASLNCGFVDRVTIDEDLVEVAYSIPMRLRTLINFDHMFVAMEEDAYMLSGDKDLIEKSRQLNFHAKVISYSEFGGLLPVSSTSLLFLEYLFA